MDFRRVFGIPNAGNRCGNHHHRTPAMQLATRPNSSTSVSTSTRAIPPSPSPNRQPSSVISDDTVTDGSDQSDRSSPSLDSTDCDDQRSLHDSDSHTPPPPQHQPYTTMHRPECGGKTLLAYKPAPSVPSHNNAEEPEWSTVHEIPARTPYPPQSKAVLHTLSTAASGKSLKFAEQLVAERMFFRDEIIDTSLRNKHNMELLPSSPTYSQDDDLQDGGRKRSKRVQHKRSTSLLYSGEDWVDVPDDRQRTRFSAQERMQMVNINMGMMDGRRMTERELSGGQFDSDFAHPADCDDAFGDAVDDGIEQEEGLEHGHRLDVDDETEDDHPMHYSVETAQVALSDDGADGSNDGADQHSTPVHNPVKQKLNMDDCTMIPDADSLPKHIIRAGAGPDLVDLTRIAKRLMDYNERLQQSTYPGPTDMDIGARTLSPTEQLEQSEQQIQEDGLHC